MRLAVGPGLLVALVGGAAAPSADPATFAFGYAAAGLECATFSERSNATLEAQTGGRQRRETLTRAGRLRLVRESRFQRADARPPGLQIR